MPEIDINFELWYMWLWYDELSISYSEFNVQIQMFAK